MLRTIVDVPEPATTRALTRAELDAWRSFLWAHAKIIRRLEAELLEAESMSLASYDVLVQLAEAPGRKLRMAELADRVVLSRSGVTRLVDRLEEAGLVARERVAGDGRGVVAVLTPAGVNTLRDAAKTHLAGVVRHFAALLDERQLADLQETCTRLIKGIAGAS